MNFPRVILAHICAVFAASAVIMAGMGFVDAGITGFVERFFGWVGGFLIFGLLSAATLPVGLALRWGVGLFAKNPERTAILSGTVIGVTFIPVLHPAMMPSVSFSTHPVSLLAVHGMAGVVGGWLWFAIEQPKRKEAGAL